MFWEEKREHQNIITKNADRIKDAAINSITAGHQISELSGGDPGIRGQSRVRAHLREASGLLLLGNPVQ